MAHGVCIPNQFLSLLESLNVLRVLSIFLLVSQPPALMAEPNETSGEEDIHQRVVHLVEAETTLNSVRVALPECKQGCITPSEAVALAYSAGEDQPRPGRFLLDVLGGGRSLDGELEDLFFVNSRQGYARFGTLTIAFEPDALWALLRRARVCAGGDWQDGQIEVRGCRQNVTSDLNMFTMMQRLGKRRIVVDGEVRLQWIDARSGVPRRVANKRGEKEPGYYQVWVRVDDADQVTFVYDD